MEFIRQKGLHFKVIASLGVIFLLILVSMIGFNLYASQAEIERQLERSANMLADSIYNSILRGMSVDVTETSQRQLAAFHQTLKDVEIFIFASDGQVTFATDSSTKDMSIKKLLHAADVASVIAKLMKDDFSVHAGSHEKIEGKSFFSVVRPARNAAACYHCHGESRTILGGMLIRQNIEEIQASRKNLWLTNLALGLGGSLLAMLLLSRLISGLVTSPLRRLVDTANLLASGDLTNHCSETSHDELGILAQSLNQVTTNLQDAIGLIAEKSDVLSRESANQASSVEETSSSLEEISSMSRQNAENTHQADILSEQTVQSVGFTLQSITHLSERIQQVSTGSEEMARIVKNIDEIAFQTNLLALNAAVEAARAGEAGSGFAVVAAEVRKLSQKAAEAARSTSQLITTNLRMIRESVELVQKTDRNFDDVAQATSKVREFLKQVSSATSEQVEGIIQVNSAVAEINRIAQTSAEMSQDMATLVSRFTLEKTDEGLMEEFGLS